MKDQYCQKKDKILFFIIVSQEIISTKDWFEHKVWSEIYCKMSKKTFHYQKEHFKTAIGYSHFGRDSFWK